MKYRLMILGLIGIVSGLVCLSGPTLSHADEWEESTPYYEDDAWYDISEWFDGNDYNPTDEVVGRWDNETYEASEDTGTDTDNDWGMYADQSTEDNWFYDFYDTDDAYSDYQQSSGGDASGAQDYYRIAYRYYDFDDDRFTDAYSVYYDWDGDGTYEDVSYFRFNDVTPKSDSQSGSTSGSTAAAGSRSGNQAGNQQPAGTQSAHSSRAFTVTGTIDKTKTADVLGSKHMVVLLKQEDTDRNVAVDLGRQDQVNQLNLASGDKIQVLGPTVKIGDNPIVLAKTVKADGKSVTIDRGRRARAGEVTDVREVTVQGQKHLLAIMQSQQDKSRQLAVDLGQSDKLTSKPRKGDQIEVQGVLIKSKDRPLLLAQSLTLDGKDIPIVRGKSAKDPQQGSDSSTATRPQSQSNRK